MRTSHIAVASTSVDPESKILTFAATVTAWIVEHLIVMSTVNSLRRIEVVPIMVARCVPELYERIPDIPR